MAAHPPRLCTEPDSMFTHFFSSKFLSPILLMATVNYSAAEPSTEPMPSSSSHLPTGLGEGTSGLGMRRRKSDKSKTLEDPQQPIPKDENEVVDPTRSSHGSPENAFVDTEEPVPTRDTNEVPVVNPEHNITMPNNILHSPRESHSPESPIVRMMKEQGIGKHAVTMVWAVVIQILTCVDPKDDSITHPLKVGLAAIILSLLFGFAVTWNGLLLRGWVAREGFAIGVEQLGLIIIYLTLVSFVALHVYHHTLQLLALSFIAFLVVLPFLIANLSGRRLKSNVATN